MVMNAAYQYGESPFPYQSLTGSQAATAMPQAVRTVQSSLAALVEQVEDTYVSLALVIGGQEVTPTTTPTVESGPPPEPGVEQLLAMLASRIADVRNLATATRNRVGRL